MVIVLLGALFVLIGLGVPIAFSIGLSSLLYLTLCGYPSFLVAQRTVQGIYSYPFLALPFFVFAGMLMDSGGITERLMKLASALVGHFKGGLAAVTVTASVLFGALSGSGVGDTAAIGSIMIPAMKKKGYDASFAAALMGCSGVLASLIPPSLTTVIIGAVGGISIGGLLLGGLVPGLLTAFSLIAVSTIISIKKGYGGEKKATFQELCLAIKGSLIPMMAPVIILGGILTGVFTVTEAAVVAVVYSLFVALFVYREVSIKDLPDVAFKAVKISVSIMIIVGLASLFGWVLTAEQIPLILTKFFIAISPNKWVFLLIINLFVLLLGTFMETTAIVIILIPVLMPVVAAYELNPIYFGIVFLLNTCVGANTPPLGVTLMTASKIADVSFTKASRAVWPFLGATVVALILTVIFPALTTTLPALVLGSH
ncbi:MAG: TRAP transporter large permease [Aminobacterium sp.]|jgi:tripartite ATP-independent transporter DctM subunit|uniref:TRAP transporter large permease n=1 Tax=unclassified Aminobacterium TaxID=2685012 RepID=UPI001BCDB093|nr:MULTISPECIES: TRAP transporter large permease [unclassified Aminobacterium]MDD2206089.1 TRAP transporter large permease [Aminobacterium sp.]MDD3707605.1 TRAP transporter large permease [Aminobacterium sp.]MDD4227754.1 TRAP transporter large permease [Aminobacterium sp.]MDD4550806.1 TRAP transporter large permease [Aminobacterium sp.]MEA4877503.1 TRAP transporter large permease [Aminobacterium sp.]